MCFVLYLASDKPRREIPWDENAPAFHVRANDDGAKRAARHFTKPNIYYLGSNVGCGCNFRQEPDWCFEQNSEEEKKEIGNNQKQLHAYLMKCLEDESSIELLGCWSGDEKKNLQAQAKIHVDDIVKPEFYFDREVRTLFFVCK